MYIQHGMPNRVSLKELTGNQQIGECGITGSQKTGNIGESLKQGISRIFQTRNIGESLKRVISGNL